MKRTVVITSAVVGGILTVCGIAYAVLKKTGKLGEVKNDVKTNKIGRFSKKYEHQFDLDDLDYLFK